MFTSRALITRFLGGEPAHLLRKLRQTFARARLSVHFDSLLWIVCACFRWSRNVGRVFFA